MDLKIEEIRKELESVVNLKTLLHTENQVLVGLEYLIYLHNATVNCFNCTLCDRKGDFFNILMHFASTKHKSKVLVSQHLILVTKCSYHQHDLFLLNFYEGFPFSIC